MNVFELHSMLEGAWGASTMSHNGSEKAVRSVDWDYKYEADGELYFDKGRYQLACEILNPFDERWEPSAFYDWFVMMF